MENKKIIFLVHTLEGGGGEKVVSELSLNLPDNIKRTIVLFKNKVSYPYKGKLVSLDVSLSQKFFPKTYNLLKGLLRFRKIVKQEKPDYLISVANAPNVFNILTKANSIIRIDNCLTECEKGFWTRIYNFLVKNLFNKATKIIVVSKGLSDDLIKNFGIKEEKIKVIYNPINIKRIQELSKEPLELEYQEIFKHPIIINIGRLTEQKGQKHLIRAFKEVKKRKHDLKLVILGKGKLKPDLKLLIQQLGLENDVHLLGWQKNPYKFLSKSKLFVFPSLWEGLGIAILEAMACGLPIISSDCKFGPREILASDKGLVENGILVPPGNEKLLAEAMIKLLNDKKLLNNLKLKGGQRAEDFNIKKIIKQWNFL